MWRKGYVDVFRQLSSSRLLIRVLSWCSLGVRSRPWRQANEGFAAKSALRFWRASSLGTVWDRTQFRRVSFFATSAFLVESCASGSTTDVVLKLGKWRRDPLNWNATSTGRSMRRHLSICLRSQPSPAFTINISHRPVRSHWVTLMICPLTKPSGILKTWTVANWKACLDWNNFSAEVIRQQLQENDIKQIKFQKFYKNWKFKCDFLEFSSSNWLRYTASNRSLFMCTYLRCFWVDIRKSCRQFFQEIDLLLQWTMLSYTISVGLLLNCASYWKHCWGNDSQAVPEVSFRCGQPLKVYHLRAEGLVGHSDRRVSLRRRFTSKIEKEKQTSTIPLLVGFCCHCQVYYLVGFFATFCAIGNPYWPRTALSSSRKCLCRLRQMKVLHPKQCSTFGAGNTQWWNAF